MQYTIVALLAFASLAYGADPLWNNLRVTWSLNPLSPWGYKVVPRDLSGKLDGFELRDDQCNVSDAKFLGQRYWYNKDPALSLLFDVNGIIAGMQTSAPKSNFTPPAYLINRNYIDEGDYYTITAYFVDPSTICSSGRTSDQLKTEGTGTGLWIQQGPDPIKDSVQIPFLEEDIVKTTWKFGKCFRTMGNHYWYNQTKDLAADHMVPNCLLYNKGKLTNFCFTFGWTYEFTSPRYEHPKTTDLTRFMNPVPDFFYNDPNYAKLSTMHVFFQDDARLGSWC